jgi:hypothetical protein
LRSSFRGLGVPTIEDNNIGFRVARPMSAPPVQPGGAMRQKLPARTAAFLRRSQPCRVQGPPGSPVRGEGWEATPRTKQTRPAAAGRKRNPWRGICPSGKLQ